MDQSVKTLAQLTEEGKDKKFVTLEVGAKLSGYTKDYLERLCRLNKVEYRLWNNGQHVIELDSLLRETHTILLSYEGITFVDKNELTLPPTVTETFPASAALKEVTTVAVAPLPPPTPPVQAPEEITLAPQIPRFAEMTRSDEKISDLGTLSFVGRSVVSDPLHPEEMKDEGSRATPQDSPSQLTPVAEVKDGASAVTTPPPAPEIKTAPLPLVPEVSVPLPQSVGKIPASSAVPVSMEKEKISPSLSEIKTEGTVSEKVSASFSASSETPTPVVQATPTPKAKPQMPPPVFPRIPIIAPMLNVNMKSPLSGRPMPKVEVTLPRKPEPVVAVTPPSVVPSNTPSKAVQQIPVPHKPGMEDIIGASMFAKPTPPRTKNLQRNDEALLRSSKTSATKDHWDELLLDQKTAQGSREKSPYHPIQTSLDASEHHETGPLFPTLLAKVATTVSSEVSSEMSESKAKDSTLPARAPIAIPAMRTMHQMVRDAHNDTLPVIADMHLPSVRESHPLMKSPGFNIAFAVMLVASPLLLGGFFVTKFIPQGGESLQVAGVGAATEEPHFPTAVSPSPSTVVLPFSDEVIVSKGATPNSIIVRPVFPDETGKSYEYRLVPVASEQK